MPWDETDFIPAKAIAPPEPDGSTRDRERRHAARRIFRAAPPFRVEFSLEGKVLLCEKSYEYWPNLEPEEATTWRTISRHDNLEEAERRLRLICGSPIYYDDEGRVVTNPPKRRPRNYGVPTDDE